jgi:hypothetical protein
MNSWSLERTAWTGYQPLLWLRRSPSVTVRMIERGDSCLLHNIFRCRVCSLFNASRPIATSTDIGHSTCNRKVKWKSKSKAVPVLSCRRQGGEEIYSFLTTALGGVSGQRHAPAALYPRERAPGTHWTGGWVGLRAGLDTEARGKSFTSAGI